MAFQRFAFQLNFQQASAPEGRGVVLFPVEPPRFRSNKDRALYAVAMIARDARGGWRGANDALPWYVGPSHLTTDYVVGRR